MTEFDSLFATAVTRQAGDVPPEELAARAQHIIAGARRKRRTRVLVNGALTAALVLAGGAAMWAVMRPPVEPIDDPAPAPSLQYSLAEPSLAPVWEGSQPVALPAVPAAFADGLDPAQLPPLVESPGPNYPPAHQMADAIWDAVTPGWSVQTWAEWYAVGDATGPTNLYLVSPAGTYFLLRELDEYPGPENWRVESWSADPGLALLEGRDLDKDASAHMLTDLRTGTVLRSWGGSTGRPSGDYTLMAPGFEGDRTVAVYFTNTSQTDGYGGADGMDPGAVAHILGPGGADTAVPLPRWPGGWPTLAAPGPDGKTAVLYAPGGRDVVVIDLDAGSAATVRLRGPKDEYLSAFAPGEDGTILALHALDSGLNEIVTFSPTGKELSREDAEDPLAAAGFEEDSGTFTDTTNGATIDASATKELSYFTRCLLEYSPGRFAFTNCGGGEVLLYHRASGESFTVTGNTVPGSRSTAAAISAVVLPEFVPGQVTFAEPRVG